jgi:hypothetical protein
MESTPIESGLSRRDFALLLGGLGSLGLLDSVQAQDEEKKLPDAQAVSDALEVLCRQKFGKILNEEQIKRVHRAVVTRRSTGDSLKKTTLQNGDDPAEGFRADWS